MMPVDTLILCQQAFCFAERRNINEKWKVIFSDLCGNNRFYFHLYPKIRSCETAFFR
jgi:hypothetical protein